MTVKNYISLSKFTFVHWIFLTISFASAQVTDINFAVLESADVINLYAANTQNIEFSPTIYREGVVYVSSEPTESGKDLDPGLQTPFFKLLYIDLSESFGEPVFFLKDVGNGYHLGPCAFTSDLSTMYFSQTNIDQPDPEGKFQMALNSVWLDGDSWRQISGFEFNDPSYSNIHPTISDDGEILIFASNRDGGYGKVDLYMCRKIESGWSKPRNMGPFMNSEKNDMFPYLYKNEWLFFASDGKEGHGGLDIYVSRLLRGAWSYPQNLGQPINSDADDMGFVLDTKASRAFFSSSRKGGQGMDDIYEARFERGVFDSLAVDLSLTTREEMLRFSVKVIDKSTYLPLSDVLIKLAPISVSRENLPNQGMKLDTIERDSISGEFILKMRNSSALDQISIHQISNEDGLVELSVIKNADYLIQISKPGYYNEQTILDASIIIPELFFLMTPESSLGDIVIPTKKGDIIVFNHLYYGFDDAKIEPGAAIELDALAEAMKKNPTMKIELGAHTDVRGTVRYNLSLSQKRAYAAKSYLINLGVSGNRIIAVGYGESSPRNHCKDGIQCTEIEHAYNRRTEVKILE